jgi:hypothetical protein
MTAPKRHVVWMASSFLSLSSSAETIYHNIVTKATNSARAGAREIWKCIACFNMVVVFLCCDVNCLWGQQERDQRCWYDFLAISLECESRFKTRQICQKYWSVLHLFGGYLTNFTASIFNKFYCSIGRRGWNLPSPSQIIIFAYISRTGS